jgi:phosphatidylinositol 3,5-bisphosphate 5-phosphatase
MRGTWGDGWAENKYRSLFQTMELTRDFYFSYTYDLTNTLQDNMGPGAAPELRHKFLWNHHLFCGLLQRGLSRAWLPPIVHGFFRQQSLTVFGRALTLTLVARRSRLFAGARLLKRGLCRSGHVANEVETEQIVADGLRGALHEGGMCAAVQLRGSIPLMWGHGEQKQIVPRPDIHLQRCDPRASAPPPTPDP